MNRRERIAADRRRHAMLAAFDEQLNSPETPEVKHHYNRLLSLGHSDTDVREMMATVLAFYLWHIARKDDYGYDDYLAELANLPTLDWKEGDDPDADQHPSQ